MNNFINDLHSYSKTEVVDIPTYLIDLSERALDGQEGALKIYIELQRISKVAESLAKDIKHLAIDEADNYPEKTFEAFGATIQKKNDAGRYTFDHIPVWTAKKNELKNVEEQAKQAYKMGKELVDASTGEIIDAAKYTEGKSNIAISFK